MNSMTQPMFLRVDDVLERAAIKRMLKANHSASFGIKEFAFGVEVVAFLKITPLVKIQCLLVSETLGTRECAQLVGAGSPFNPSKLSHADPGWGSVLSQEFTDSFVITLFHRPRRFLCIRSLR